MSWWSSGDYAGDPGTLFGWPGCPLPDGLCHPGFGLVCDAFREKEKRSGLESTRGIRAPHEAPAQVWGQAYAASPWLCGSNILKIFKTSMQFLHRCGHLGPKVFPAMLLVLRGVSL